MGHPDDLETTVRSFKTSLEILGQPALARYVRRVVLPDGSHRSDDDFRGFVRDHCRTPYRPVGTCRMGSDDQCVVDTRRKLRGFEGLRLCDSSVPLSGRRAAIPQAMAGWWLRSRLRATAPWRGGLGRLPKSREDEAASRSAHGPGDRPGRGQTRQTGGAKGAAFICAEAAGVTRQGECAACPGILQPFAAPRRVRTEPKLR